MNFQRPCQHRKLHEIAEMCIIKYDVYEKSIDGVDLPDKLSLDM